MKPNEDGDERLLDRTEVETRFGISRRYLEKAAARGGGPPMVRISRLVRYRPADVRRWIESRLVDGDSATSKSG